MLAANIRRVREAQRLGFAELARMLSETGRPIPELGLRRIEKGERRVDFDDLLALAYVLKVCPVDLMVSNEAAEQPYPITPTERYESDSVRDWISGTTVRLQPVPNESPFTDPSTVLFDAVKWMPRSRRAHVLREVLHMDEEDL